MIRCPVTQSPMLIQRLYSPASGISVEGRFQFPRLMRVSKEHLHLAEAFLLRGGNLKELSIDLDISYPTLRKRLDDMIEELQQLKQQDDAYIEQILQKIENQEITAEQGMREIKEIKGEL